MVSQASNRHVSEPLTPRKRLPAATTHPNTGPSYPWKWGELRKFRLSPVQRIELCSPSGLLALLKGAPLSSATLISNRKGSNDKHTCTHVCIHTSTHKQYQSPCQRKERKKDKTNKETKRKKQRKKLGGRKAQFTGIHNSSRFLLGDDSQGFSQF